MHRKHDVQAFSKHRQKHRRAMFLSEHRLNIPSLRNGKHPIVKNIPLLRKVKIPQPYRWLWKNIPNPPPKCTFCRTTCSTASKFLAGSWSKSLTGMHSTKRSGNDFLMTYNHYCTRWMEASLNSIVIHRKFNKFSPQVDHLLTASDVEHQILILWPTIS